MEVKNNLWKRTASLYYKYTKILAKVVSNNKIPQITNAQDANLIIKIVIKILQIAQWLLKMAIKQSLKEIVKILKKCIKERIKKIKFRIGASKTYKV